MPSPYRLTYYAERVQGKCPVISAHPLACINTLNTVRSAGNGVLGNLPRVNSAIHSFR